jgi:hypothetical protein
MYLGLVFFTDISYHKTGIRLIMHIPFLSCFPSSSPPVSKYRNWTVKCKGKAVPVSRRNGLWLGAVGGVGDCPRNLISPLSEVLGQLLVTSPSRFQPSVPLISLPGIERWLSSLQPTSRFFSYYDTENMLVKWAGLDCFGVYVRLMQHHIMDTWHYVTLRN